MNVVVCAYVEVEDVDSVHEGEVCVETEENNSAVKRQFVFLCYVVVLFVDLRAQPRSHYCQQLTLSVCPSICLSRSFKLLLLFLFLDGIEPFFGCQFSMWHSTKRFLRILIQAPKAQYLLPKICTKSPISQIDRRCLGLLGVFWGWPIQWNHTKCCGANPCCHGNEIWARRGDPVAYRFVCQAVTFQQQQSSSSSNNNLKYALHPRACSRPTSDVFLICRL